MKIVPFELTAMISNGFVTFCCREIRFKSSRFVSTSGSKNLTDEPIVSRISTMTKSYSDSRRFRDLSKVISVESAFGSEGLSHLKRWDCKIRFYKARMPSGVKQTSWVILKLALTDSQSTSNNGSLCRALGSEFILNPNPAQHLCFFMISWYFYLSIEFANELWRLKNWK